MVYLNIRLTVANYDRWRSGFDANRAFRRRAGATGKTRVFQDVDDPNTVTLILQWDTLENANRFLADPALQEAMQNGGIIGTPTINIMQAYMKA
jgi:hypothetical protein